MIVPDIARTAAALFFAQLTALRTDGAIEDRKHDRPVIGTRHANTGETSGPEWYVRLQRNTKQAADYLRSFNEIAE